MEIDGAFGSEFERLAGSENCDLVIGCEPMGGCPVVLWFGI